MPRPVSLTVKQALLSIEQQRLEQYDKQLAKMKEHLADVEAKRQAKINAVNVLKEEIVRLTPQ